jgi:predicted metal-dependent peptidase
MERDMSDTIKPVYDLEHDIYRLLIREPFFAALSRHINKVAVTNIPTAGVRIDNDGRFELAYNPDFMRGLSDRHRVGVLKHEMYHLIFEHCMLRSPDGKKISKRWNWATDLAINSHLRGVGEKEGPELPDFALWPDKFGYENEKSAEWYYAKLQQDGKGGNESGPCTGQHASGEEGGDGPTCDGSCGNFDSHDGWGEGGDVPQEVKDLAKERLREAMKQAAQETASRASSWGSVSSDVRKQIMRFINGTVDWRAVLRAFVGNAQKATSVNTVKRINKRYPYIHAGKKSLRTANIAISIDQSGSVSDELLGMFYAELDKLAKLASFTIIPFDCEIAPKEKIYVWKKGERREKERVLSGGTDFTAPTKYVNEKGFDGHIILTDMQADKPIPSRCRRMWMTDETGAENIPFKTEERVIVVKKIRQ